MRRQRILAVMAVVGVCGQLGCARGDGGPGTGGSGPMHEATSLAAGVELADWRQRCRTNIDCGAGSGCIIPAGASIRTGVCGTVVDHEGVRLAVRARSVPACFVRQDCPLAFSCLKVSSLDGLCVK